jgi:two-component system response regulator QseB
MHVLLCEDDELIASGIVAGLNAQGLNVDRVATASAAQAMLHAASFDVMVLDLGLPDEDGLKLLQRLRQRGEALPVLVLTARDSVSDRVAGLQAGADDYLLKPFDLRELCARLHTLQRRVAGRTLNIIEHGLLQHDPARDRLGSPAKPSTCRGASRHCCMPCCITPAGCCPASSSRTAFMVSAMKWKAMP